MKDLKKILIVVVAAVIGFVAGAVGMRVYDSTDSQIDSNQEEMESNQEELEDPADEVGYYGCPNSRKVKKLNLFKSKRVL